MITIKLSYPKNYTLSELIENYKMNKSIDKKITELQSKKERVYNEKIASLIISIALIIVLLFIYFLDFYLSNNESKNDFVSSLYNAKNPNIKLLFKKFQDQFTLNFIDKIYIPIFTIAFPLSSTYYMNKRDKWNELLEEEKELKDIKNNIK